MPGLVQPEKHILPTGSVRNVTFGLSLYTGQSTAPIGGYYRDSATLAAEAEKAGFDVFWVSEHHGTVDGYLPSPLVVLAAAAQATSTIGLGTGLALAPLVHPVKLAEDAVVLDHLSGGRLTLGLGIGYVPDEFRTFGVPMTERGSRLSETVAILRRAWTGEEFSFQGTTLAIDRGRVRPAALRADGIPIWLGGYAAAAVRRAGRIADGHLIGRGDPDLVNAALSQLESVRSPDDPSFTIGVNLALIGADKRAGEPSARDAFARQQRGYERIQTGTDVYADRLQIGDGPGLNLGNIEQYVQLSGEAANLVDGIAASVAGLGRWARAHVALRAIFPGEPLDVVLDRISYLGSEVLPAARLRLASDGA